MTPVEKAAEVLANAVGHWLPDDQCRQAAIWLRDAGLLVPQGSWQYGTYREGGSGVAPWPTLEKAWRIASADGYTEEHKTVLKRRRDVLVPGTEWELGPEPWSLPLNEKGDPLR